MSNISNLAPTPNVSGSSSINPTSINAEKDKESLWYFTSEQLMYSPSRRHGIDVDQELSYRQMTAYLIQEMGQRLQVSQLCINTAIVYMHRFYAFHSFTHFHRNGIAAASLFLAAKVEEQPRKLEHVIKAANKCLNQPTSSTTDAYYLEQAQDLVFNENVLLQTLGFDVAIDHPHTHVVKTCHLVKACKDLAQTSYFLASNSLHLTSMCLKYKPTVVACFCIYLACKWSRWEIPQSTEGKHWFHYVDRSVTMDLLKQLTDEFIAIYEKSPARLKSKLNSIKALAQGASNRVVNKDKKAKPEEWKMVDMMKMYHSSINTNEPNNAITTPTSLSNSAISDQQSLQSGQVPNPVLPSQSHSQPPVRRPDTHTSQHRGTHHSTSTTLHHAKQSFAANDVTEPKAGTNHKQQQPNSSATRPRDHTQYTQNINAISVIPSSSSATRGSVGSNNNGSRPVSQNAAVAQKVSSQAHESNFHKSRDRTNLPATANAPTTLPQSHKVPQKNAELGRMESNKSSNKMFAPQSGSTQLGGPEMPRNLLQQQRLPPPGYHQSTMSRTNTKHDHNSPFPRLQTHHKHPLSLETQFGSVPSDNLQAQSHHSGNMKPVDTTHSNADSNIDSAHTFPSLLPFQNFKLQSQQPTKMPVMTAEFNEVSQNQQMSAESNRKFERERSLSTPTKKDRSRSSHTTGLDVTNQSVTAQRGHSQQLQKSQMQRKVDTGNISNVLAGSSASAYAGVKRLNESASSSQDSELNRDSKMRKLDTAFSFNFTEPRSSIETNKLQIVNGIETNPDLVRTLLKESLCTANAFIKTEPLPILSHEPPVQLLQPSTTNVPLKEEKVSPSLMLALTDMDETAGSKSDKKKKKDKHKHKEKDKFKDREDRKKHKKDKDRHRVREEETSEPVKIKISKDKLECSSNSEQLGLKIKIPKDRLNSELNISGNVGHSGSTTTDNCNSSNITSPPALKIKISKDKIENYSSGLTDSTHTVTNSFQNPGLIHSNQHSGVSNNSSIRKKERDRDREKEKKRNISEQTKLAVNGSGTLFGGLSNVQPPNCSKNNSSSKF